MRVLHITHTHIHTGWGGRLEGDKERQRQRLVTQIIGNQLHLDTVIVRHCQQPFHL